jgi:solute carrier family 25 carnitine/acylcarnitine transporter 20/29
MAQVVVGHPLDTIKVRLQTQPRGAPAYSGMMDCARQTLASEGPSGFFKGMLSPLVMNGSDSFLLSSMVWFGSVAPHIEIDF